MTMLNQLNAKIAEFGIEGIKPCGVFDLNQDSLQDKWPCADDTGIYAIFSVEKLLYIGQSSNTIGARLGDYFKKGDDDITKLDPKHTWTSPPTHFATWKIEETTSRLLELEKFLIRELNPCDNTHHNT